jgi:hypothetical protein
MWGYGGAPSPDHWTSRNRLRFLQSLTHRGFQRGRTESSCARLVGTDGGNNKYSKIVNHSSLMAIAILTAGCSVALGAAAAWRKRDVAASWLFLIGMSALAGEAICNALSVTSDSGASAAQWRSSALWFKAVLPGVWLSFSLSYARGSAGDFLRRWRLLLAAVFIVPVAMVVAARSHLVSVVPHEASEAGWIWQLGVVRWWISIILHFAWVLILLNRDKTFLASWGTSRWRL